MSKTNTIEMKGKQYPVNFSSNYFYKYFKQASGLDLVAGDEIMVASIDLFDRLAQMLYAGHRAYCSIHLQKCELTQEDCTHFVMSKSADEVMKYFIDYGLGRPVQAEGEGGDEAKNAVAQGGKKRTSPGKGSRA